MKPTAASTDTTCDLTPHATSGCVWIQSDLQLSKPEQAERVLADAVADIAAQNNTPDVIWCLGDALVGSDLEDLERVAAICVEQLELLGLPICYVMGNHEMDYRRSTSASRYPLYELAQTRDLWHTTTNLEDLWFMRTCLGCDIYFLGDHADPQGGWHTSHHRIKDDESNYPHDETTWQQLHHRLASARQPLMTASHYAYPGGQRPGPLMANLLPLPAAVRSHVYGHAHIGDMVYNGERPWQRDNPVDGQTLRQFNISALENVRTPGSHSALLHFTDGIPTRLDIRCHLQQAWVEQFEIPSP